MAARLDHLLTAFFGLWLEPLSRLQPFWGIAAASLLTALLVLSVYRWVSSPRKIKDSKNRIKAHILAIRLYRDSGGVIARSFAQSLWHTLRYFTFNLSPLLLTLPLLAVLFVQLDIRFGLRPWAPGETFVLKLKCRAPLAQLTVELQPSNHYRALMPPVHIRALNEVDWQLQALQAGSVAVLVNVNGKTLSKSLVIGQAFTALSEQRLGASSWRHLLRPAEPPLDVRPPLADMELRYPARRIRCLGLSWHWLVLYLLLTFLLAWFGRKRFGVEF